MSRGMRFGFANVRLKAQMLPEIVQDGVSLGFGWGFGVDAEEGLGAG